ncbi:acyl carrier protein [Sphingomonas sp. 22L2VL55-3]|jgi:acyl carrier protein
MSEFYEGIAEILEVEPTEVNPDLTLDKGTWDSLAIVSTIALIDELYDKTVSGEVLEACTTVGDLEKAIEAA